MLDERDLATIRAALAFWRDEMTSHGVEVQAPYFDDVQAAPLSADEIDRLRETLRRVSLRTARFAGPTTLRLLSGAETASGAGRERFPIVMIPPQDPTGTDESLAEE